MPRCSIRLASMVSPLVRRSRACANPNSSVRSAQTGRRRFRTKRERLSRRTFERIADGGSEDVSNSVVSRFRGMEAILTDQGEIELRMHVDEPCALLRCHIAEHRVVLPDILRRAAARTAFPLRWQVHDYHLHPASH